MCRGGKSPLESTARTCRMAASHNIPHGSTDPRPRYRQPIGLPMRDEGRRTGALVSVVVHALIVFLLIVPFFMPRSVIQRMQQGAGGAGPAGGGGGGSRGTGGPTVEQIQFVRISPTPVPTPTALPAVVTPPPVAPKIAPKVEPPKPVPVEPPPTTKPQSAAPATPLVVASAVPGTGGGSGND